MSVYSAVPDGSLPLLMYGSMALEASAPAGDIGNTHAPTVMAGEKAAIMIAAAS